MKESTHHRQQQTNEDDNRKFIHSIRKTAESCPPIKRTTILTIRKELEQLEFRGMLQERMENLLKVSTLLVVIILTEELLNLIPCFYI